MVADPELLRVVREDLEYLRDDWGALDLDGPAAYPRVTSAPVRQGAALLRRLLLDGALQRAWNSCIQGARFEMVLSGLRVRRECSFVRRRRGARR